MDNRVNAQPGFPPAADVESYNIDELSSVAMQWARGIQQSPKFANNDMVHKLYKVLISTHRMVQVTHILTDDHRVELEAAREEISKLRSQIRTLEEERLRVHSSSSAQLEEVKQDRDRLQAENDRLKRKLDRFQQEDNVRFVPLRGGKGGVTYTRTTVKVGERWNIVTDENLCLGRILEFKVQGGDYVARVVWEETGNQDDVPVSSLFTKESSAKRKRA